MAGSEAERAITVKQLVTLKQQLEQFPDGDIRLPCALVVQLADMARKHLDTVSALDFLDSKHSSRDYEDAAEPFPSDPDRSVLTVDDCISMAQILGWKSGDK